MYDIFQDIHGQADDLERLLSALGYTKGESGWEHPERKAIFVGDLIDGGKKNKATIEIVKSMYESGMAKVVLGNHELNAIAFSTLNPKTSDYYRKHSAGNIHQHQTFLDEYVFGSDEHAEVIDWFRSMPLYLDMGTFSVVHACWCSSSIREIDRCLGEKCNLSNVEHLHEALDESTLLQKSIDVILKGTEIGLPDNISYLDKYGKERDTARLKWWEVPFAQTMDEYVVSVPKDVCGELAHYTKPLDLTFVAPSVPVFCGHYKLHRNEGWSGNVLCLDIYNPDNLSLHAFSMMDAAMPKLGKLLSANGVADLDYLGAK